MDFVNGNEIESVLVTAFSLHHSTHILNFLFFLGIITIGDSNFDLSAKYTNPVFINLSIFLLLELHRLDSSGTYFAWCRVQFFFYADKCARVFCYANKCTHSKGWRILAGPPIPQKEKFSIIFEWPSADIHLQMREIFLFFIYVCGIPTTFIYKFINKQTHQNLNTNVYLCCWSDPPSMIPLLSPPLLHVFLSYCSSFSPHLLFTLLPLIALRKKLN